MRNKIFIAVALVLGLLLTFIDSRPNWDDTSIIAIALIFSGIVIGVFILRRPWLCALLLGIWIPLWGIIVSRNFGSLLALVFAFAGVYIGWLSHLMITKARSQS
jgi:hypothetical protein